MGVDISSYSGVAVSVNQMVNIVTEANKELACRTLLRYTVTLFQSLKDDMEAEELDEWERKVKQQKAATMVSKFAALTIDSTVDEIRIMLKQMAPGVKEALHSYVENSELAVEIWGELIEVLHQNAPAPEDAVFIGSPRYQGWDLPQNEVLLIFSENDCFESVKAQAGEALDEMIGEITSLSSWTIYSV